MATPESIAIRRADALTRVEAALGRIATQTGVEIAPYPEPHKRPEVRPAIEAEWLADALEAIAGASGEQALPDPSLSVEIEADGTPVVVTDEGGDAESDDAPNEPETADEPKRTRAKKGSA